MKETPEGLERVEMSGDQPSIDTDGTHGDMEDLLAEHKWEDAPVKEPDEQSARTTLDRKLAERLSSLRNDGLRNVFLTLESARKLGMEVIRYWDGVGKTSHEYMQYLKERREHVARMTAIYWWIMSQMTIERIFSEDIMALEPQYRSPQYQQKIRALRSVINQLPAVVGQNEVNVYLPGAV